MALESLQRTVIPTDPVAAGAGDWPAVALKALDALGRLAEAPGPDPSPVGAAVRAAIVASLITSGLLWGAHELLGAQASSDREARHELRDKATNARIDRLDALTVDVRIQLAAIAQAVGATPRKTDQ